MSEPGTQPAPAPETTAPVDILYFPVSLPKLLIMSLCTFGLYQPFWLFSQWYYVREREKPNISLLLRVFFAVFFCYPLFRRIRATAKAENISPSFSAAFCTAGWIIFVLLAFSPSPLSLISVFSVLFLLPVQRTVNAINMAADPEHDPNSTFSVLNKAAVVIGGLVWLLGIVGLIISRK